MSLVSKKVYLSSDVFFAFIDRAHPKHKQAAAFFRYFSQEKYALFTDQINLYETYRNLTERMSPSVAKEFLRITMMSNITVIYPDESDMKAVYKLYLNDKSGGLEIRQILMAVLANRRGIQQIATFEYMQSMFGISFFFIPI